LPIATKKPDQNSNLLYSLNYNYNITDVIENFKQKIGQEKLNILPFHDMIMLANNELQSVTYGDKTVTFAVPCSLMKPRKTVRADCKTTMKDLKLELGSSSLVVCKQKCFANLYGTRV